jgi:hypothetical protein
VGAVTSVYLAYNAAGQLLYVGISLRPRVRLAEHVQQSEWWPHVQRIDVEHYDTRPLARARELDLIRTVSPLFNKEGRKPMADLTLDMIREARAMADAAEAEVTRAVKAARLLNRSWEDIGRALGVTRQSAWERYGRDTEGGKEV